MVEAEPRQIDALYAHVEGLEAAVDGLEADPDVATSLRRIARSLQAAAEGLGATEIAAGAQAIQRATDAQLAHSVRSFLERVDEIRAEVAREDVQILLVEHNKTVAAATTAFLRGPNRTVHGVATAEEAEGALRDRRFDLVILDLILPDRDGRDLLVQLREAAATAHLPVIVLSAKGGSVARAECLAVGANAFLEKPVEPKALRSTVTRLLRHARARRDAVLDGLTGLVNRVGLADAYAQLQRTAHDEEESLSVALLRLDGWAEYAAARGRDAADRFLLEATSTVHALLESGDVLGRWETARLVALLPEPASGRAASFLARAVEALGALPEAADLTVAGAPFTGGHVTVGGGTSLHDAIAAAERALLRAHATEQEADAGDAVEVGPAGPTFGGLFPLAHILLVEDDRVTGTLIHHRLMRDGHKVTAFDNGEDAYEFARAGTFDLAVLDVKVPGMDGFELLERLRAMDRYAEVPIVMLTGMGSEADVIRGLELGADDYMLKPFSPSELLARVRRLLQPRSRSDARPLAQDAL